MHLSDFLTPSRVAVQQVLRDADSTLSLQVSLAAPPLSVREELRRGLTAQGLERPTARGNGVAMPRVRWPYMAKPLRSEPIVACRNAPTADALGMLVCESPSC